MHHLIHVYQLSYMFDLAGNAENYGGTLAAHRLQRIRALGAGAVAHPALRAGAGETRILGRCVMTSCYDHHLK